MFNCAEKTDILATKAAANEKKYVSLQLCKR